MTCWKCGQPMTTENACENKRCPEAHKGELCKRCGEPPADLVRVVANAGVFRCPNGHEIDCLVA